MAATKTNTKKKKVVQSSDTNSDISVSEMEVLPPKVKSKHDPIELDDAESLVGAEEKILEDDPLNPIEIEDDEMSEVGIDGEELNPFGDRWEE